jgi:hypothetical protein
MIAFQLSGCFVSNRPLISAEEAVFPYQQISFRASGFSRDYDETLTKEGTVYVSRIEKGEEFFGGWATPTIPQVGIYKLLAKKKADDTIEWAHCVERDNGRKEKVMRGTVSSPVEFDIVIDTANNNLSRVFGVTMQPAGFEVRTPDGRKASDTIH